MLAVDAEFELGVLLEVAALADLVADVVVRRLLVAAALEPGLVGLDLLLLLLLAEEVVEGVLEALDQLQHLRVLADLGPEHERLVLARDHAPVGAQRDDRAAEVLALLAAVARDRVLDEPALLQHRHVAADDEHVDAVHRRREVLALDLAELREQHHDRRALLAQFRDGALRGLAHAARGDHCTEMPAERISSDQRLVSCAK